MVLEWNDENTLSSNEDRGRTDRLTTPKRWTTIATRPRCATLHASPRWTAADYVTVKIYRHSVLYPDHNLTPALDLSYFKTYPISIQAWLLIPALGRAAPSILNLSSP